MSHFYCTMVGKAGEATRSGTVASGMTAHVRGWDVGVKIHAYEQDGVDCFAISASDGSSGGSTVIVIGTVKRIVTASGEDIIFVPNGYADDAPFHSAPVRAGISS